MSRSLSSPPRRVSLVEHLADEIAGSVREDRLTPGDRLPTVQILARRFSVGAPTVREALSRLQAVGLIEIRHGSGTFVKRSSSPLLLRNPHADDADARTLIELLDARLLIEPDMAERAARSATPDQIGELEATLDEAGRFLLGGPEAADRPLHEANMRFHGQIAAATGNRVLAGIVATLLEVHDREQLAAMSIFDDRRRDHAEHRAIFGAIRNRRPQRARTLMRQHLQDVKAVVEARLNAGQPPEPD